jgi:hypothetical protein
MRRSIILAFVEKHSALIHTSGRSTMPVIGTRETASGDFPRLHFDNVIGLGLILSQERPSRSKYLR